MLDREETLRAEEKGEMIEKFAQLTGQTTETISTAMLLFLAVLLLFVFLITITWLIVRSVDKKDKEKEWNPNRYDPEPCYKCGAKGGISGICSNCGKKNG